MLQIKKKLKIDKIYYNLQFILKKKSWVDNYKLKKTLAKSIILRSPKHFNIGKQKVSNLNYKLSATSLYVPSHFCFSNLFLNTKFLYNYFEKQNPKSIGFSNKSIKMIFQGKFSLKWLEF